MEKLNVFEYTQKVANLYVKWATKNALVSDEVLFSSIGEARCRQWAIESTFALEKESLAQGADVIAEFLRDDRNWKQAVLIARYGKIKGLRKFYIEHMGMEPEIVEKFLELLSE